MPVRGTRGVSAPTRGPADLVGREVGRPDEERLAVPGPPLHQRARLVAHVVGDVGVPVLGDVPVVVLVEVHVVGPSPHGRVPERPALLGRSAGSAEAVEVLADQGRVVARVLQPPTDGVPRGTELRETAVHAGVRVHPAVLGVLAGDDLGAGRAAQRVGRDAVGERGAGVPEPASGPRHPAQVADGLVVGQDEDDVRLLPGRRVGGRAPHEGTGCRGHVDDRHGTCARDRQHRPHQAPERCPHELLPSSVPGRGRVTSRLRGS